MLLKVKAEIEWFAATQLDNVMWSCWKKCVEENDRFDVVGNLKFNEWESNFLTWWTDILADKSQFWQQIWNSNAQGNSGESDPVKDFTEAEQKFGNNKKLNQVEERMYNNLVDATKTFTDFTQYVKDK